MKIASSAGRLLILLAISTTAYSQGNSSFFDQAEAVVELAGTTSTGDYAPLWLSANRQGKVSALAHSAYERAMVRRDMSADEQRDWRFGYALDLIARQNAQLFLLPQQAYLEGAWKKISLTLGVKERQIDLRNNELTSGGLSLGINATPLPEVLAQVSYFPIPGTKGWWQWNGRLGYGMTTDGRWQKRWIGDPSRMRYTGNTLYHEKAIYWKFGREDKFPLTFEIGLQMMSQFGGTSYNVQGRGIQDQTLKNPHDLNAFWHAFSPMGSSDATDGAIQNAAGNTVGSYNMRLQWKEAGWSVGAYFERFFEDQSMLTVQYGFYDHLLGVDATLPANRFVSHLLVEHLSTRDQSGPVYHDQTQNMPYHIAGIDDYYNHGTYTGWQHWGMSMGTPLLTSPIYNDDHSLLFWNNRVMAWHFGLDGDPCPQVHWRALASFTRNWGSYNFPFPEVEKEQHILAETTYTPSWIKGWQGTLGIGLSHGALVGNTFGVQLSLRKTFHL